MHYFRSDLTLETLLCHNHQRNHCHIVGSGTAGLYLSIKALGIHNGKIAIPNGVCPNVVMAVYFSGNTPVYLDVDKTNLGISISDLRGCSSKIDLVIAVHAYGAVCDIESIQQYCSEKNIPLIEDMAVAMGASYKGQPVGSFGDISVISFGSGKIIDENHGGAVLANDDSIIGTLKAISKELKTFSQDDERNINSFGRYHTHLYNSHYGIDHVKYSREFKKKALSLKDNYLFNLPGFNKNKIIDKVSSLQKNIDARKAKANFLTELFLSRRNDHVKVFVPPEGSIYWRYCIFIEKHRDSLLRALLKDNFKISSWFPSVDLFFEGNREGKGYSTPEADQIGDTILNIWVNHEVDYSYLERIHDFIMNSDCYQSSIVSS